MTFMNYLTEAQANRTQCCGPCWNSPTRAQGCTASLCMGWRWRIPAKGDTENVPPIGYCGLAGKS